MDEVSSAPTAAADPTVAAGSSESHANFSPTNGVGREQSSDRSTPAGPLRSFGSEPKTMTDRAAGDLLRPRAAWEPYTQPHRRRILPDLQAAKAARKKAKIAWKEERAVFEQQLEILVGRVGDLETRLEGAQSVMRKARKVLLGGGREGVMDAVMLLKGMPDGEAPETPFGGELEDHFFPDCSVTRL